MEKKVLTTCPYCGAGCQFYLVVDEAKNKILRSAEIVCFIFFFP